MVMVVWGPLGPPKEPFFWPKRALLIWGQSTLYGLWMHNCTWYGWHLLYASHPGKLHGSVLDARWPDGYNHDGDDVNVNNVTMMVMTRRVAGVSAILSAHRLCYCWLLNLDQHQQVHHHQHLDLDHHQNKNHPLFHHYVHHDHHSNQEFWRKKLLQLFYFKKH